MSAYDGKAEIDQLWPSTPYLLVHAPIARRSVPITFTEEQDKGRYLHPG